MPRDVTEPETQHSVLFVSGGRRVMRHVFDEHAAGYWSAAFDVLLEKHGWLDFERAEPAILADREGLQGYDLIIVAWLPAKFWKPEYVDSLLAFEGVVFLEGPLPPSVGDRIGARLREGGTRPVDGALSFSESATAYIRKRFGGTFRMGHRDPDPDFELGVDPEAKPLWLLPKRVNTRRAGVSRDQFLNLDAATPGESAARAAISLALAYRARFVRDHRIFEVPLLEAYAVLFCVRTLAKVEAGPVREALAEAVQRMLATAPVSLLDSTPGAAGTVWGVALAEAAMVFEEPRYQTQAGSLLRDRRSDWAGGRLPPPAVQAWTAYLGVSVLVSGGALAPPFDGKQISPFLPGVESVEAVEAGGPDIGLLWVLQSTAELLRAPLPLSVVAAGRRLDAIASDVQPDLTLPPELDGKTLPDVLLLAGALKRRGHIAVAGALYGLCLERFYDDAKGNFRNARVHKGKLVEVGEYSVTPYVGLGLADLADPIEIKSAASGALLEYTDSQVEAWAAPPYWVEPLEEVEGTVEVAMLKDGAVLPVLWKQGRVIATSAQLLAHLAHAHTMHPLEAPYAGHRHIDAMVLEHLLFHVIDETVGEQGRQCPKVAPWPWGVDYWLTIRHDVDRILDEKTFRRLFDFENDHDLAVTWFWLPGRLERGQLRRLDDHQRHEIGLHSIRLGEKASEIDDVSAALPDGSSILGEAYHGAGDSWLGHSSVREANEVGLLYTELVPEVSDLPYWRFPRLEENGDIGFEEILGITFNGSIDGRLGDRPETRGGPGFYQQYLNHPDINFDRLQAWIDALPEGSRMSATCAETAIWWKATHRREALQISRLSREAHRASFRLLALSDVEDLELRLNIAASEVLRVGADTDDGSAELEWAPLEVPEYRGIRVRVTLSAGVPRTLTVDSKERSPSSPHVVEAV